MARYPAVSLFLNGLSSDRRWPRAWRAPEPKPSYDVVIVVIVGGGGHWLATVFYLAENHGIRNVAVIKEGYLGGGNVGRNATIIRSNACSTAIPNSTNSRCLRSGGSAKLRTKPDGVDIGYRSILCLRTGHERTNGHVGQRQRIGNPPIRHPVA